MTVVPTTAVQGGAVGEKTAVSHGKEEYEGNLVAVGKLCECSWIYNHFTKYRLVSILCEPDLYSTNVSIMCFICT